MMLKKQLQIRVDFAFKTETQTLQLTVTELLWKRIPLCSSPYLAMGW